MSRTPGNPYAPPSEYQGLAVYVPNIVRESWDWQRRCGWRPDYWKQRMPNGLTFVKALKQRLECVDSHTPTPSSGEFDSNTVRRPCELAYTEGLTTLNNEFIKTCRSCDPQLLKLNQGFFKKQGTPDNHIRELDVLLPRDKKWERHMRHRTGYFIPFQQKEAFCFNKNGLYKTCVPTPKWFAPYEVHYGFHAETPPILTYKGSFLMTNESGPWWQVFLTEWAAMVAFELMYQARRGRLHYITPALRQAIRDVGCITIMEEDEELASQLSALLREIELIRWSQISPKNRALPEHALTLYVSVSGNWVAFDTDAWESQMDEEFYVEEGDDGLALNGPDLPIGSLTGYIDRQAEAMRSTRPSAATKDFEVPVTTAGEAAEKPKVQVSPAPDSLPSAKQQARATRVLNSVLHHAGVDRLIRDAGYPNGISLDGVADILQLHFTRQGQPRIKEEVDPIVEDRERQNSIKPIAEEIAADDEAKSASTKVKEEAEIAPTEPIVRPKKRRRSDGGGGASPSSRNRRITEDVIDLVSNDSESSDS